MAVITVELLRRRAEHNGGCLDTLQEVTLHQQNLEGIGVLNQACRHLRHLYLQNNVISRIENLHRLKDLAYLNLAVNNVTVVENLEGCESLRRLDLTLNFVGLAGLSSLASLRENPHLRELSLVGNPCTRWEHYRLYLLALLPGLAVLDGEEVTPSERITAKQRWPLLCSELQRELDALPAAGTGAQPGAASEEAEGYPDESGDLKRPWCPATRLLEHREQEQEIDRAAACRRAGQAGWEREAKPPRRERLAPLEEEGAVVYQKNEGKWDFSLGESGDGRSVVLRVALGRHLDTSLVEADVQPRLVRLLAKGRLLQLHLPEEVRPDGSTATRSRITGQLVIAMPKAALGGRPRVYDLTRGAAPADRQCQAQQRARTRGVESEVGGEKCAVAVVGEGAGDDLPPVSG